MHYSPSPTNYPERHSAPLEIPLGANPNNDCGSTALESLKYTIA